jgi:hypothetical protein
MLRIPLTNVALRGRVRWLAFRPVYRALTAREGLLIVFFAIRYIP